MAVHRVASALALAAGLWGGIASEEIVALYSRSEAATDVAVLGGGIIGLAVAWRARQRGLTVRLIERDAIGHGASSVAAGMLAPVTEVELGAHGRTALGLGLRSASIWPGFVAELEGLTGMEVGFRASGTLMVARDADEARELERQLAFRESIGVRALRLRASETRAREPSLAPTVRAGLEAPDDHSVDPRRVLVALRRACELTGVEIEERAGDAGLALDAGERRLLGVHGAGALHPAEHVVAACGAWSGALEGLPAQARPAVRPVKGQTVRLRDPSGPGLLRGAVRCQGAYLVPRADGTLVVGATVEERGFEREATAGAVHELLHEANELVPGISELYLEELAVGLRPGSPDNLPLIGPGACEGLIWATGHYRNGILLAPLTAELVSGLLLGESSDPLLAACDPARLGSARALEGQPA